MLTTSNAIEIVPDTRGKFLIQSVVNASVAAQVATVVNISTHDFRMPVVTKDPTASWTAEGEEITPSDMTMEEASSTPSKVAGLSIITRELANDSSPAAAEAIGQGLAREIARQVDRAFFGNLGAPAPKGLYAVADRSTVATLNGITSLDPFVEALTAAEIVGAQVTAFVTSPLTALALAKLKKGSDSNEPLLAADPSVPTGRVISGVPLYVTPFIEDGSVWAIPRDRAYLLIRENAQIETDHSAFFTSDRVAIKGTMRVGTLFPHEAAIVHVPASTSG
ncbi:phage major capsid protein [Barrientosiimonas endolithica]|uniref:Phage capsid-like C-terminal domain-containing protein n=1 Tax=Barrientosiimonas endolithica TaxID=1535208 RepID=A0ABM8HAB2_9MICO|nr:phage major capsid protein [Barrientosiimonas endolithica]BDZ57869.1 hypothetical protein GCM10025872_15260 [Barrientosiimonas endolithica]